MTTFLEKVDKLPEKMRDFLASNTPRIEVEKVCFLFGMEQEDIEYVSEEVGYTFIGEDPLEDLPFNIGESLDIDDPLAYGMAYEIAKRIFAKFPEYFTNLDVLLTEWETLKTPPLLSENEAYKKVLEIEPWIVEEEKAKSMEKKNQQKEAEEKMRREEINMLQLSVTEAIRIYPEIGEQIISREKIKVGAIPEPVRPSVKNWITDYNFQLGNDTHSSASRANYLFQNINGRGLSASERNRVAQILKSLDDYSKMNINKVKKEIVFSDIREEEKVSNNNATPVNNKVQPKDRNELLRELIAKSKQRVSEPILTKPSAPMTNVKKMAFSSPQTLAYEKLLSEKEITTPNRPLLKQSPITNQAQSKNVVDLREN